MYMGIAAVPERAVWQPAGFYHIYGIVVLYPYDWGYLPVAEDCAQPPKALQGIWVSGGAGTVYSTGIVYMHCTFAVQARVYMAGVDNSGNGIAYIPNAEK
jgi:hypothetical protein